MFGMKSRRPKAGGEFRFAHLSPEIVHEYVP
jgi:hypothetical protein